MPTPRQGYKAADGKKIPSVTTVLKIKDPGALINWAYKQGREHGLLEGQGRDAPGGLYDTPYDMLPRHLPAAVVATEGHKPADLTEITGTLVIRN